MTWLFRSVFTRGGTKYQNGDIYSCDMRIDTLPPNIDINIVFWALLCFIPEEFDGNIDPNIDLLINKRRRSKQIPCCQQSYFIAARGGAQHMNEGDLNGS